MRRALPRSARRMPPASSSSGRPGATGVAVEVVELEPDLAIEGPQAFEQLGVLLARPAPEENRQAQRLLHLGEDILRDGRQRELATRRQVEAVVGPLRHHLEEPETGQQEEDLEYQLRPAACRPRERHQRTPRQRRASSAKNVKPRNAAVNRMR